MEGKRFRRIQNGRIYEVVGRVKLAGKGPRWILWDEQTDEREYADDFRLAKQLGWEVVGSKNQQRSAFARVPPPLMKKAGTE